MSIFGKEPQEISTLDGYNIIFPENTTNADIGEVMQIQSKDSNVIKLEWDSKNTVTETEFQKARIIKRLDMGNTTTTPDKISINIENDNQNALTITEGENNYIIFNTDSETINFEKLHFIN